MDLYLSKARASATERRAIDALLGPATSGWEGGKRRSDVDGRAARGGPRGARPAPPAAAGAACGPGPIGWISEGALNYICQRLTIPPAEAYGVASFYAMFSLERRAAERGARL